MEEAIRGLFWWRESITLESVPVFRRQLDERVFDPNRYDICTEQTKELGIIYDGFMVGCCIGFDSEIFAFVDRIFDFIKEQAVPEPVYNDDDNSECRETVDGYYE